MALSGTPTPKCLTLAEAKRHLNIEDDFTDDDQYIDSLIDVAQEVVSQDICVSLGELIGKAGGLPAPLRQAMLLMIGNYYASRESVAFGVLVQDTKAYRHLIALYRNYSR